MIVKTKNILKGKNLHILKINGAFYKENSVES